MITGRRLRGYAILIVGWLLIQVWQYSDHQRFAETIRASLLNRVEGFSTMLAIQLRTSGRYAVADRRILTAILEELTGHSAIRAVALLDSDGEVVLASGDTETIDWNALAERPVVFTEETLTVRRQLDASRFMAKLRQIGSPDYGHPGRPPRGDMERRRLDRRRERDPDRPGMDRYLRNPLLGEEFRNNLIWKPGLQQCVVVVSSQQVEGAIERDLWTRLGLVAFALLAVIGLGLGWRGMDKSLELRVALARSRERAHQLEEKNVAAAGLAHETRNPLNIIRGLAQLIQAEPVLSPKARQMSGELVEEVDRVTSRLNAFIEYSRPPDPQPVASPAAEVVTDVLRTLQGDLEENGIVVTTNLTDSRLLADPALLRQLVFNLVLNAIQACPTGGRIGVDLYVSVAGQGIFEIRDSGPGVPPDDREAVFRPYVTSRPGGAGLGLAVVRQIAQAHDWEVTYFESEGWGAGFRVAGLQPADEETA
jgi:signal transduction histidine kinase